MGFDLKTSCIDPSRLMMDLELVGMSRQLWIYKTWLEVQSAILSEKHKFHIFNASEAGACGMLARKYDSASMGTKDNWFLMDDVHPKWTTTTLLKACEMYLKARGLCQTHTDAGRVMGRDQVTGIAKGTVRSLLYQN